MDGLRPAVDRSGLMTTMMRNSHSSSHILALGSLHFYNQEDCSARNNVQIYLHPFGETIFPEEMIVQSSRNFPSAAQACRSQHAKK